MTRNIEEGITKTVKTIDSSITVNDIIKAIGKKKSDAVVNWVNKTFNEKSNVAIFGTYLTGLEIASELNDVKKITIFDIYPYLEDLLRNRNLEKVNFNKIANQDLSEYDIIIDTTGLGGVDESLFDGIKFKGLVIEDPSSSSTDEIIQSKNETLKRLENIEAKKKAILYTESLDSKTSGTMTLTLDIIRKSVDDTVNEKGVLYAVGALNFYERIIFKEKNVEKFLKSIERPAITCSSIKDVDLDEILMKNLNKIDSQIRCFK